VFYGTRNAADPSKFKFTYELGNESGWAEVQLVDAPPGKDDPTFIEMIYSVTPKR
jgi:hypothetical protein